MSDNTKQQANSERSQVLCRARAEKRLSQGHTEHPRTPEGHAAQRTHIGALKQLGLGSDDLAATQSWGMATDGLACIAVKVLVGLLKDKRQYVSPALSTPEPALRCPSVPVGSSIIRAP